MSVHICTFCNTLKDFRDNVICDDCYEDYTAIKSYIEKYPGTPVMDISIRLNINLRKIMRFVEHGKFVLVNQDAV